MNTKPKLICLTPVCNNAWVLRAFLEATCLWADHIIIADQNSTDGSREICKQYPKIILVENNDEDFNEASRQQLLISTAQKEITGDKVLIALDSDEIFASNYAKTADWQKIVNAKAGDVFVFKWATLDTTGKKYNIPDSLQQWGIFDDGTQQNSKGKIHVARVPWPQNSTPNEIFISDFQVIHLSALNTNNDIIKRKYYQMFMYLNNDINFHLNIISAFRGYTDVDDKLKYEKYLPVPDAFFDYYSQQGINIFDLIDKNASYNPIYSKRILNYFDEKGIKFFQKLDIWDKEWLKTLSDIAGYEIKDVRSVYVKLLHFYLRKTQKYKNYFVIRLIDKTLKKLF
jgi:hypothetical protein